MNRFALAFFIFVAVLSALVLFISQLFFPHFLSSAFFSLNQNSIDKNVVIVAIDENTLNNSTFKRWQDINRCDYSTAIKNVLNADAKAVGLDVFLSTTGKDKWCDSELQNLLAKNPNVYIGTEYNEEKKEIVPVFDGFEKVDHVALVNSQSYSSIAEFAELLLRTSHNTDLKNSLIFYKYGKDIEILPLSLALYKTANNIDEVDIDEKNLDFIGNGLGNEQGNGSRKNGLEKNSFPHDNGRMFINFFTAKYPRISFIDVVKDKFDPAFFKGKTVIIGSTATDIHDEFFTPYDTRNLMPGVVIHANAYNTLSADKPISPLPFWAQMVLGLVFVAIFSAILTLSANILRGILYGVGLLMGTIAVSGGLFAYFWIFVEVFPLVAVSVFVWFAIYLEQFIEERKSKNEIRSMFSKYVSADVASELIAKGIDGLGLWGSEREISVFFSDIAGFTDLSEQLKPEDLWKVLNVYFEAMSGIILSKRGTIDKFIGDAVMAFWNAPIEQKNHAELACESAILQRQALESVRETIRSLGADTDIDMRIGINTGKAIIGNFWCSNRYDYTALGDSVNLASRLESISKQYGTNIVISESTKRQLPPGKFIIRELDIITVKGKKKPVKIFELVGFQTLNESEKLAYYRQAISAYRDTDLGLAVQSLKKIGDIPSESLAIRFEQVRKIRAYAEALALYRDRKFEKAAKIFRSVADAPSLRFAERCEEYERDGVPNDWDGVYRFTTK